MYLLIVTGMSGAGKSTALNALEEMGYYCVDNLPSPMLPAFVEMCDKADVPIERAAVAVDSRESLLSAGPEDAVGVLRGLSCRYEVLFLDARDEALMERYNETRRRHPLGEGGDAASGVAESRLSRLSTATAARSMGVLALLHMSTKAGSMGDGRLSTQ